MMPLLVTSITNEESTTILPVPSVRTWQTHPDSWNRSSSRDCCQLSGRRRTALEQILSRTRDFHGDVAGADDINELAALDAAHGIHVYVLFLLIWSNVVPLKLAL